MRTIQEGWETYASSVVPKDAPQVQIIETRRAFYAGAAQVLHIMWDISSKQVSDNAGVGVLEGLHQETSDFLERVGKDW